MNIERLHNPVTGETINILESTAGELRFARKVQPGRSVAADVVHLNAERTVCVLAGKLAFRIGGKNRLLRKGQTMTLPPGVSVRQWNPTGRDVRVIEEFRPAGRTHGMLRVLAALARKGLTDARGKLPLLLRAAFLAEFRDVMRPASAGQRFLFAILRPLSGVFGYRRMVRVCIDRFEQDIHRTPLMSFLDTGSSPHSADVGRTQIAN